DSLGELTDRINDEAGAVLLAKEGLTEAEFPRFKERIAQQPAWSDLPLLVLTHSSAVEDASLRLLNLLGPVANVTLIERPMRSSTLISAIRVALRARRRQYEMRELLEQRETVLASISDAFSAIDRDWRYTYVNDHVSELARVPKDQLLGRVIWEIFPEAVGTDFYHAAHRAMADRQAQQAEVFHQSWNRWLDTRIYPTKDGIVVFRADITERKRQELLARDATAKLKESEDRLRLATEAAAIGTFDFYPQTGQLRFSSRTQELLGIPADREVEYTDYINAIHPDDRHIAFDTVERVQQPGSDTHYNIEYRVVPANEAGERWIAERGRVVLDENGRASRFIGTLLDITERKNFEITLERAKQEAEAASRAKDQFLAMLSHELRTPLTPVLMTIAALRRDPDLSDSFRADLEVLQRNVELEALLIDDLLDLTRIAHGKLELHYDAVDVHAALEHALSISAPELQAKQIVVTRHYEAVEHHAWADAARLQQVFWNLVKNAAKFTPIGGRVDLRTRNDDSHQLIIEVEDNGIGIEPSLMPRIFDAFEQGGRRVTSQFGGLGLGLAISKRVIDMHGGTITAESEGADRGATFTVRLKAMETSMLDGSLILPLETTTPEPVQILFLEDHADTARVLKRILENAGFAVQHAATLAQARALAAVSDFDLVISDLGLPDGSGLDLMRELHSTRALRGIALSGFGMDDDRAASSAAGFTEHLTKPVDWPQLRSAIDRVLATGEESTEKRAAVS
ncbi:MAG TPA: ATP-binding protein, partial [Chthoniobacterales bacterium]